MTHAIKRLANEQRTMLSPAKRVSDYFAEPLEDNIYEWHFTIRGPAVNEKNDELPYKDGIYHGKLKFPTNYPFEPPDIFFYTANGRFKLRQAICSTISSYHKELWRPTYDIGLILTALRLFMAQEGEAGIGSIGATSATMEEKLRMARESWAFECPECKRSARDVWAVDMEPYPATAQETLAAVPSIPSAAAKKADAVATATAPESTTAPAPVAAETVTEARNNDGNSEEEKEVQLPSVEYPPPPAAVAQPTDTTGSVATDVGIDTVPCDATPLEHQQSNSSGVDAGVVAPPPPPTSSTTVSAATAPDRDLQSRLEIEGVRTLRKSLFYQQQQQQVKEEEVEVVWGSEEETTVQRDAAAAEATADLPPPPITTDSPSADFQPSSVSNSSSSAAATTAAAVREATQPQPQPPLPPPTVAAGVVVEEKELPEQQQQQQEEERCIHVSMAGGLVNLHLREVSLQRVVRACLGGILLILLRRAAAHYLFA